MWTRIRSLLFKDVIQFARDKIILAVVFYLNTICILICGYAMTFDVRDLPVAVIDTDRSVASRALIDQFSVSEAFEVAASAASQAQAEQWMRSGKVNYVLVIPNNFDQDLRQGKGPQLQVLLDGTNANTASLAKDYTAEIVRRFEAEFSGQGTVAPAVRPVVQVWYNRTQTLESFAVLSMITSAFILVATIYCAASMMREKESGTIDQLMVTPTRVWEIFLAKTIATVVVVVLGFFPSLLIIWWFGVPLLGSLPLFIFLAMIFSISAVAIGMLISSITQTMQQALLLCFFGLYPMLFLSGTVTPIDSLPTFLQPITYLSPARYFQEICVGIFLKGSGWAELWPAALSMAAIGITLYLIAAWRFQHKLLRA